MRHALEAEPDYIDLEYMALLHHQFAGAAKEVIDQCGPTKLILSYHDFEKTPADLHQLTLAHSSWLSQQGVYGVA